MPRPKWAPKTDAQRAAVEAVVRAAAAAGEATAALRAAVEHADQLDVPRTHQAAASGIKLRTFYRRLAAWTESEPSTDPDRSEK